MRFFDYEHEQEHEHDFPNPYSLCELCALARNRARAGDGACAQSPANVGIPFGIQSRSLVVYGMGVVIALKSGVARVAPSPPGPLLPLAGEGEKDSMYELASVGLRTTADPISPSGLRSVLRAQRSGARDRNRNRCSFFRLRARAGARVQISEPLLPLRALRLGEKPRACRRWSLRSITG